MSDASEFDVKTLHTAAFWDERYAANPAHWSGRVNQRLAEQAADLRPGDALELGCGEGGDAMWLAQQGWTVLATDVSAVVVERARATALATLEPAVAARITWRPADVLSWQPDADSVDLVTMHYLQLPRPALVAAQARLAVAVRPGGRLLMVNHDPADLHTAAGRPVHMADLMHTAAEIVDLLDPDAWQVEVADAFPRPFTDHDGHEMTIHDTVVRAVRR